MTDFARLLAADRGGPAHLVHGVSMAGLDAFRAALPEVGRAAVESAGFAGREDQALFLPGGNGRDWGIAVGLGEAAKPGRWTLASAAAIAPAGSYRLAEGLGADAAALHGWVMAQHRFDRFRRAEDQRGVRRLLVADPAALPLALAEAAAAARVRDLVDTPAEQLGPAELEAAAAALAATHGARCTVATGAALAEGWPAIAAVGRASPRAPRRVRIESGDPRWPLLALVGKGVCFDTGGLNLKPGAGMALMKKDMGGAAHALALAGLLMEQRVPVRILLLLALVDNAVDGGALRPGDVIATRRGCTVEIGNTDAEGRLVLADVLAEAAEAEPALILDFATLTGAARIALGPDLPALFANDDALADALLAAGAAAGDPLWRLPLWRPYRQMFRSTIADLNNHAEGGLAGAIVGALFLEHFVPDGVPWAHLDLYAWNGTARPGRPKGGAAMGLWAAAAMIAARVA